MTLVDAYKTLQSGSLWSSTGRCKGYAVANPGEAAKIDAYVAALARGDTPAPPTLATATGNGIVGMLSALALPAPVPAPNPTFGTSLPPRLPEATGQTVDVATTADLQSQLANAAAGTRIRLRAGTYGAGDTTAIAVTVKGTRTAPVHVEAYPGDAAPVIAKLFKIAGAVRFRGITFARNSYPTDVRFGQGGANPGGNVGLWINGADVELDRCLVSGATMSGLFGMGDRVQVWNTRITGNGTTHDDHGIYWGAGGAGGLIANCVIDHNACFGFQIQYATAGVVVANCTIVYNGIDFAGSGTVQAADARDVLYVNTVAAFNGEVGFKSYTAGANNRIRRCLAYGNPQGATYGTFDAVENLLTSDPRLDGTYRPAPDSPAVGAGDPDWTPPYDRDGVARLSADLGALAVAA